MSKTFNLLMTSLNEIINDLEKNNGKNLKKITLKKQLKNNQQQSKHHKK